MDIMSIANMATQMQQQKTAMEYSVAMLKQSQDVQKMLGNGAIALIESASINGDAAAFEQGKGKHINVSA